MGQSVTLKALRAQSLAQAPPRLGWRIVAVAVLAHALLMLLVAFASPARADAPIKTDVTVTNANGFVRIVFHFAEEIDADVRLANGIVVVGFKKPVELAVDKLATSAPGYVSVARRDPDGSAVRLALARKVTVNSMAAGERLFVDLLPDTWTGVAPGLPQEVIEELAKRAREAERKAKKAQALAALRQVPPIRVKVGTHPTFTRYVFDLPIMVTVAANRERERLDLSFEGALQFDLADVKGNLPPTVAAVVSEQTQDTAAVRFTFNGTVDVRTFREDMSYVVDVSPAAAAETREPSRKELPTLAGVAPDDASERPGPPATIPAYPGPSIAPAKPPVAAAPPPRAAESPPLPTKPRKRPSRAIRPPRSRSSSSIRARRSG